MVSPERLAATLETDTWTIEKAAGILGLVRNDTNLEKWAEWGFLTIIRRNWDLLSYEQLLTLLDWDADKMAFVLKGDDFMWHKMGSLKPACQSQFQITPRQPVKAY